MIKSVSLVGNGPITQDAAKSVDNSNLVIRFNRALLAGSAGKRTDVLVIHPKLSDFVQSGQPIGRQALRTVREIWLVRESETARAYLAKAIPGRPVHAFPNAESSARKLLAEHGAKNGAVPSSGATALSHILEIYPGAVIHMYGFTFEGISMHDWVAEKRFAETLQREGRVSIHVGAGRLARPGLLEQSVHQAARLRGHLMSFRF